MPAAASWRTPIRGPSARRRWRRRRPFYRRWELVELRTYLNGALIAGEHARIGCNDAGFLVGDGLFETLRVDCRQPLDVEAHLDRLFDGLERIRLSIPESRDELRAAIDAVAAAAPQPVARLRVTVTRGSPDLGPTRLATAASYSPPAAAAYDAGVAVVVAREFTVDERDPLRQVKSISWQRQSMALAMASEQDAFEAILLNRRGGVAEGSRSNVIARVGGPRADTAARRRLSAGHRPTTPARERPGRRGPAAGGRLGGSRRGDAGE